MNHLIKIVKSKISANRTLVENFSYLSFLQVFNLLLPIITYPYLVYILGTEIYGRVIFAQVIASYFGILIDFGFRITATKEISIYRNNKSKLSEIVSSVLIIKFFLWILSFGILYTIVFTVPIFHQDKILYLFSFAICFNELLFPQWYFQGIEKMKYITVINLVTRLIFLSFVFIIVKNKSDYLLVPLLNGFGIFVGGIIGLIILFGKKGINFKWPTWGILFIYVKNTLPLFGSNAIISLKDRFNVIFIGSSLGMSEVALYDLSIKIMGLFMQPSEIINTTIYPKMAKEKNMRMLLQITKITFVFLLFAILAVQPFLPTVIDFLVPGLHNALIPVRLMLIAPLIMVWSLSIGRNCLLVHGEYKTFTIGMALTSIFYFMLIFLIYLLGLNQLLISFVIITIMVYLFEMIYRIAMAKKLKLI